MQILAALLLPCLLTVPSLVVAQQKGENKMVQFHMALLKKGPNWTARATQTPETQKILEQHVANVLALLDSGKAVAAGPADDDSDLGGVLILRAPSAAEARSWTESDPAVRAGLFVAEMHPWWSEDVFKKRNSTLQMTTVYLAFLKKGPNRKDGDGETPEIQELQKAHIANINRLAEMKKLVVAGPFGDDGPLRGIFVFRVGSLKEAEDLCASDPMIKIKRLVVELHPWKVREGLLP